MANFRERIAYRSYRVWRFLKLNWRNFIVIGIAYGSVAVGLWSVLQLVMSPSFSGATMLYIFLIVACLVVFDIANKSKRGRFDYLLLDEDD